MKLKPTVSFLSFLFFLSSIDAQASNNDTKIPDFSYLKDNVNILITESQKSTGLIWDRLAEMTDLYGPRITGSKALEDSISWIEREMKKDGLKVYSQKVTADYWKRNEESLIYHSPTRGPVKLSMLGLGRSIGTPKRGITGEVISVVSRDDLTKKGESGELKGKIVLCNFPWTGYGAASFARQNCAQLGEKYGAIAALVKSATPFSINTPHTGVMKKANIPGAAITYEDAQMFGRIEARAKKANSSNAHIFKKPIVTLKMGATIEIGGAKTRNLIAELKGREKPDEIIIVSGHIDSWDIGVGAEDDAAGAFVAWEALRQISKLPIRPRRTIRAIMWTNEEAGTAGGLTYYEANKNNLDNHILAMESDSGTFEPQGFYFAGNPEATKIFKAIGTELLGHTTFGKVTETTGSDEDISPLCDRGIPSASLWSKSPNNYTLNYFTFHHSAGDRMEVLDPDQLARNAAMTAGFIYAVADLKEALPKTIVPETKQ